MNQVTGAPDIDLTSTYFVNDVIVVQFITVPLGDNSNINDLDILLLYTNVRTV